MGTKPKLTPARLAWLRNLGKGGFVSTGCYTRQAWACFEAGWTEQVAGFAIRVHALTPLGIAALREHDGGS